MQSSLIGKIEKAKRYAQERDRVSFQDFTAHFRGEHDSYEVQYHAGHWRCTCHFFEGWGTCSHIMAIQRMFPEHLPREAARADAAQSAALAK